MSEKAITGNRFANAREAKEYLVSKVAEEAQRENVPLTELERQELYFSEGYWMPPNMLDIHEEFERRFDQTEYERKIAGLIRNAVKRLRKDALEELAAWKAAARVLAEEDHYILVMIYQAGLLKSFQPNFVRNPAERPPGDAWRLLLTALALVIGGLGAFWVYQLLVNRFR